MEFSCMTDWCQLSKFNQLFDKGIADDWNRENFALPNYFWLPERNLLFLTSWRNPIVFDLQSFLTSWRNLIILDFLKESIKEMPDYLLCLHAVQAGAGAYYKGTGSYFPVGTHARSLTSCMIQAARSALWFHFQSWMLMLNARITIVRVNTPCSLSTPMRHGLKDTEFHGAEILRIVTVWCDAS